MNRLATLALTLARRPLGAAAQAMALNGLDPKTAVADAQREIDDAVCTDGVGRGIGADATAALFAAATDDSKTSAEFGAMMKKHVSCWLAAPSAEFTLLNGVGLLASCTAPTRLPVGIAARAAVASDGWITCNVYVISNKSASGDGVRVRPADFKLVLGDGTVLAPNEKVSALAPTRSHLVPSQGVVLDDKNPIASGVLAYPAPASAEPPMLLVWEETGDRILIEETADLVTLLWEDTER